MDDQARWPVVISDGDLVLRPLRVRDQRVWHEVRRLNHAWLSPWEATRPLGPDETTPAPLPTYVEMVMQHRREGRTNRSVSLAIWLKEGTSQRFVGQITLGGIVLGALRGAHIGYWIDSRVANRGITTKAVSMLTDYGFRELGLHRIEINLRPENGASKRVAEKCGYTLEGVRPKFLHIDGQWRDHLTYVKVNEQVR